MSVSRPRRDGAGIRRAGRGVNFGPETFLVRIADDAMAPLLPSGHWVWVDPDEPMGAGLLVAFDDASGGVSVRRLVVEDGRRILRAVEPAWPDIVVTYDNETDIRGVVVFVGRAV